MLEVKDAADLSAQVGQVLGVSDWLTLTEEDVLGFAEVTRDRHWVHTDPERAARETEFGGVLAHGFLVLSLITGLSNECFTVTDATRWLNYGVDRVRFLAPVVPGDQLRLQLTLEAVREAGPMTHLTLGCELQRNGSEKPVMAATWLVMVV